MALAVSPPSINPLQEALLSTTAEATTAAGSVTVPVVVPVHPLASVTVTVYVEAPKPSIVAEVAEVLHA